MITLNCYELWNGKRVVGRHLAHQVYVGREAVVVTIAPGHSRWEEVRVPLRLRVVSDDGINLHMRTVFDVRRKSKRQISILDNAGAK